MTQLRIIGDVRWAGEGTHGCAGGRRRPCGCHGLQRGAWPDRGARRSILHGGIDRVPEHVDHDDVQEDDDHETCHDRCVDLVALDEHVVLDELHHLHDLHDLVDVEHYDDHRRTAVHTSAAASTTCHRCGGAAAEAQ